MEEKIYIYISKDTVGANNSGKNEGRERKCLCTGSEGKHANGLFFPFALHPLKTN